MKYLFTLLVCALLAHANARGPEIIKGPPIELLRSLIEINTGTENLQGLARARGVLIPSFEKLGFVASERRLEQGRVVLSFEMPGAHPRFALVGHLDTVFEPGSEPTRLTIGQEKISGPGVIDMKGGLVLMLDALQSIGTASLGEFRIIINDDEEVGSPFSRQTLLDLTEDLAGVIVFEPGLPDGSVVTSQSGVRWLELTSHGQAAHAGLEPENGVNACVELSQKLVRLAALTDLAKFLSVNIGTSTGGTKPNVVCQEASARVDVRFREQAQYQEFSRKLENILSRPYIVNPRIGKSATTDSREIASLDPVPERASKFLFDQLRETARGLGMKIAGRHVGYASDANNLAVHGRNVLVGLGPYGGGMHTADEFMDLKGYDERLRLVAAYLEKMSRLEGEGK